MFRRLFGSRARRAYEKGIERYDAGEMTAAIEHFDAALSEARDRTSTEATLARFYRGEAHARLGAEFLETARPREALTHFDAALTDHPAYPDLHLQRGLALLLLDDPLAAERAARQAIERNASFAEAGALLVLALHGQGLAHRADEERLRWREATARQGHALATLFAAPSLDLDALLRHRGAQRERRRDIERVDALLHAGFWNEAIVALEAMLAVTPDYPDLRLRMAAATCGSGDRVAATAHLRAALERNPRFADAHVLGGVVALHRDRIDEARVHFGTAEQLGSVGSPVRYGQVLCALRTGEWRQARQRLDALWVDEEFHAEARALRAVLAWLDDDEEGALALYEDALAEGARGDLLVDAACLGLAGGRLAFARRAVDRLPPGAPEPVMAVVRATLSMEEGSRDRAIDLLEAATARHPSDPALLWCLAAFHAARGEGEVALRRLANLRALGEHVPGAAALAARLHRQRGEHVAAIEAVTSAAAEEPTDSAAALELLFALRCNGDAERARAVCEHWIRVQPLDLRWRAQDPARWLTPLPPWPTAQPDPQ